LICVSLGGLEVWRSWSERADHLAAIRSQTQNLARSLAQHADDTLDIADAALVDLVNRVETQGVDGAAGETLSRYLATRIATLPRLSGLFVYDATGRWAASSRPTELMSPAGNAGRAYFTWHRTHAERGPLLGPAVLSHSSGQWVVTLTRRYDKPDGSFGGVVAASIDAAYFASFYGGFDVGSHGTIGLLSDEGKLLSRYPFRPDLVGSALLASALQDARRRRPLYGDWNYRSTIDQVERLGSYWHARRYPVTVVTALGRDEALASWRRVVLQRGVLNAVLILIIALTGDQLARELRRRQRMEMQLARHAATDGLTGLANRRAFDEALRRAWQEAARSGTPLSLILIDADRFKAFNDSYGHLAGDACLSAVARATADSGATAGTLDLAARYGGEELAVLLPDADAAACARVAERIRGAVEALAIRHDSNPPWQVMTVSAGHATVYVTPAEATRFARAGARETGNSAMRSDDSPQALIAAADAALYRAKREGRNQVCGSDDSDPVFTATAIAR
jgi:diguanylate cyclase (GGDEF)-like protein